MRIVTGFEPSDVLHWRLIDPGVEMSKRVSCGQEVPPDSHAAWVMSATVVPRSYAPVQAAVICSRNRQATAREIVLRNFAEAICAHLVFSLPRATAVAIRARNSSTGMRRMPSVRNLRVAASNTAKALESCVTVSLRVRGSREIRNVPSTHPATVNPPARDPLQKYDGVVSRIEFGRALDGGCQMRRRARPASEPQFPWANCPSCVSTTSTVVIVQIAPFSQRDSAPA